MSGRLRLSAPPAQPPCWKAVSPASMGLDSAAAHRRRDGRRSPSCIRAGSCHPRRLYTAANPPQKSRPPASAPPHLELVLSGNRVFTVPLVEIQSGSPSTLAASHAGIRQSRRDLEPYSIDVEGGNANRAFLCLGVHRNRPVGRLDSHSGQSGGYLPIRIVRNNAGWTARYFACCHVNRRSP